MAGEGRELANELREAIAVMREFVRVVGEASEQTREGTKAKQEETKATSGFVSGFKDGAGFGGTKSLGERAGNVAGDLLGTFARETGAQILATGDPVKSALRGVRSAFGDPGLSAQANTESRVAEITGTIARFGGEVNPELRARLVSQFGQQEVAVQNELSEIRREANNQGKLFLGAGAIGVSDIVNGVSGVFRRAFGLGAGGR